MSLKISRRSLLVASAVCAPMLGIPRARAADKGLITIIVADPANPYWYTEGQVAKAEAEKLGYRVNLTAHKYDTNVESTQIDTAITNKSVAIILDPADANGSVGAVKRASDAGVPVFCVNAELNGAGLAKAQLVSNNAQGAAIGAMEWVKVIGDQGDYAELYGQPSDNNAQTRSNGYATVLGQYPGLKKVAQEVANWDRALGYKKMDAILQAHPNIIGVISGNDEMALGAIAVLKEHGKLAQVKVGGFDGSPDAVAAVKAGDLQYTVLQPVAVFSAKAVQQADTFLRTGKTGAASEKQLYDCVLITKENVGRMTANFTYA